MDSFIYKIKVADICIKIESQIPLYIEENMQGFLHTKESNEKVIKVQAKDEMYIDKVIEIVEKEGQQLFLNDEITIYETKDGSVTLHKMFRKGKEARLLVVTTDEEVVLYADRTYAEMFETEGKFFKYIAIDKILLMYKAFYLHSSLIKFKGKAILFSGPSGIGKSTQARLWEINKDAKVLNGDRSIVRQKDDKFYAYGSPFAGSSKIYLNEGAEIKAIVFLAQGKENLLIKADKKEAFKLIYRESMLGGLEKEYVEKAIELIDKLVSNVSIYKLTCRPDREAVEVLDKELFGKNQVSIRRKLHQKAALAGIPINGTFELTPLCNMNCKMCYVKMDKEKMHKSGTLMSREWWIELGRKCKEQGTLFLLLTGGEVFARQDFREIYCELAKMGFVITINTNGTLIDENVVSWLKENPPSQINVTMYGGSGETYEKLCGNRQGFEQVTKAIDLLLKEGFQVRINISITKENVEDLETIYDFAKERNIVVASNPYMFKSVRDDSPGKSYERIDAKRAGEAFLNTKKYGLDNEKYKKLINDIYMGTDISGYDECERNFDEHMGCLAGKASYWVTWNGQMTPCGMMSEPFADMTNDDFVQCFEKIKTETKNIYMPKQCGNCSKRKNCMVCAAVAMSESGGDSTKTPEYMCDLVAAYIDEACAEYHRINQE